MKRGSAVPRGVGGTASCQPPFRGERRHPLRLRSEFIPSTRSPFPSPIPKCHARTHACSPVSPADPSPTAWDKGVYLPPTRCSDASLSCYPMNPTGFFLANTSHHSPRGCLSQTMQALKAPGEALLRGNASSLLLCARHRSEGHHICGSKEHFPSAWGLSCPWTLLYQTETWVLAY